MAAAQPSRDFALSLERSSQYPANQTQKESGIDPATQLALSKKLRDDAPRLCVQHEDDIEVCVKDVGVDDGNTKVTVQGYNIHSEPKLKTFLGVDHGGSSARPGPRTTAKSYKKDPISRLVYIAAANSRAPLRLTISMLHLLLTYHQVMADIIDFITLFGLRSEPRETRLCSFRRRVCLKPTTVPTSSNTPATSMDELGRSSQHFQVLYHLKGVTQKGAAVHSIRSSVFYHRYDVGTSRAFWMVVKGGMDILESYEKLSESYKKTSRVEDNAFGSEDSCFTSSLAVHLLFCRWAMNDWQGYIRWLEDESDKIAQMAVLGPRGKTDNPYRYQVGDIRELAKLVERAGIAKVSLEGNLNAMTSLSQFYQKLAKDQRFPRRDSCADELADFEGQLDSLMGETRNYVERLQSLIRVIADRKELIIQYRASESEERMLVLNQTMKEETEIVRVITLVALFYLPATFVSSFFSTDIVKYQDNDYPDGKFSDMAMYRWLQVTLPLTFLTLIASWAAKKWTLGFGSNASKRLRGEEEEEQTPYPPLNGVDKAVDDGEEKVIPRPAIFRTLTACHPFSRRRMESWQSSSMSSAKV